jgi:hypothetical protein
MCTDSLDAVANCAAITIADGVLANWRRRDGPDAAGSLYAGFGICSDA